MQNEHKGQGAPRSKIVQNFKMAQQSVKPSHGRFRGHPPVLLTWITCPGSGLVKSSLGDFPGDPEVKKPAFSRRGLGFSPWSGSYVPTRCRSAERAPQPAGRRRAACAQQVQKLVSLHKDPAQLGERKESPPKVQTVMVRSVGDRIPCSGSILFLPIQPCFLGRSFPGK